MADASVVLDAVKNNIQQIEESKKSLDSLNQETQAAFAERSEAIRSGTIGTTGKSLEEVIGEKNAELEVQKTNQDRAAAINYQDLATESVKNIVELKNKQRAVLQDIRDTDQGNFFQQLAGIFTIPYKQNELARLTAEQNLETNTLSNINQQLQSSNLTTKQLQNTLTTGAIAATSAALAADKVSIAAANKIQALQTNAEMVQKVSAMNGQQLDAQVKGFNVEATEEHRQFLRDQRVQFNIQVKKMIKEEQATNALFDMVNLARTGNGQKAYPEGQKELVKAQMRGSGPAAQQLQALASQGMQIQASGKVVQGNSPTEAAEFRQAIGYTPNNVNEEHTLSIINGVFSSPKIQEVKGKENQITKANELLISKLKQDQENISTAADSLTKPTTWANFATSEVAARNQVWQKVIKPTITDNIATDYIEPKDLFNRLVTAVSNGNAKINEAAILYKEYADYSIAMNNSLSGLEKLTGLKQTKFIAALPQPATGFLPWIGSNMAGFANTALLPGQSSVEASFLLAPTTNEKIDGTDLVKVTNAISKSAAYQLKRKAQ